jgi:hypothetical protein
MCEWVVWIPKTDAAEHNFHYALATRQSGLNFRICRDEEITEFLTM